MAFSLLLAVTLALRASTAAAFPAPSVIAAFNSSIGGKVHLERPIGAVCYKSDPLYNAAACAAVTAKYGDDQYRSDQFASYEQINWETCGVANSCLLPPPNDTAVCGQGSVPSYSVRATSTADVQAYVTFATKYNLRIVIKNTGHDYKGRSAAPGGFALWTHALNTTSRNKAFVPAGCKVAGQDSLTLGAGVQWEVAYKYADDQGVVLVGGDNNQVGAAGGWLLGGGHSILSPKYGLGVDNLLQAKIVTADGKLHTVSACSNPDLFWALRGGGGGTFGVVTEITYKAHKPDTHYTAVFINTNSSASANGIQENSDVVAALAAVSPQLLDLGVGGFIKIFARATSYFGLLSGGNATDLQNAIAPYVAALPEGSTVSYVNYTSFYEFFGTTYGVASLNEVVGITTALAAWIIPTHYFENDPKGVAAAILAGQEKQGDEATRDAEPVQVLIDTAAPSLAGNSTSMNPAWYKSAWFAIYLTTWANHAPVAEQRAQVAAVHNAADVLRKYAPDGGAYQNEADIYEPNYEANFWGPNVARLKTIKKQVDPKNYFQVWQGIGYDGAADPKYSCYKELNPGGYAV